MHFCRANNLFHFTLKPAVFEMQICSKSEVHRMISEWSRLYWFIDNFIIIDGCQEQQLVEHATFKRAPYIICTSTFSRRSVFSQFPSRTSLFWGSRLSKIGNVPSQIFSYTVWQVKLSVQSCRKAELHVIEWLQNDLEHITVKGQYFPRGHNFGQFYSTVSRFEDLATILKHSKLP